MILRDYLAVNKISSKMFSKKIGVSEVSISRYLNGSRIPSMKILRAIYKETKGFVSANDFIFKIKSTLKLSSEDKIHINFLSKNIRRGSRKFLAKAITLVESTKEEDQMKAEALVSNLPANDKTLRIGVSGVPGVGKSTFIESFGLMLLEMGYKVAVLAVDPTSQKTGGSILGDKTRMERLSIKENSFIRPSPSKGHLGGVAKSTRESISCVEASGYDVTFVETMGVGQAETAVYNMVDIFLVLLLPSGGDDLQGIKKGIIELSDLLIVNKADDNLLPVAKRTVNDYENALSIIHPIRPDWKPKVLKCSSINLEGMNDVWNLIDKFISRRRKNKNFYRNRSIQNLNWMWEILDQKLSNFINKNIKKQEFAKKIEIEVLKKKINPNSGANIILSSYLKNFN